MTMLPRRRQVQALLAGEAGPRARLGEGGQVARRHPRITTQRGDAASWAARVVREGRRVAGTVRNT